MDGIEKITGRIAADTEAEIASIQAEARRQADEITARYEAQAKREAEEIAARGRRSAEERQARLASVPSWTPASWSWPPSRRCWPRPTTGPWSG